VSRSFWLDTKWGCGLVTVNDKGIITEPIAMIFWKLRGQNFDDVMDHGKNYRCKEMA